MADTQINSTHNLPETMKDMGDGSYARRVVASLVDGSASLIGTAASPILVMDAPNASAWSYVAAASGIVASTTGVTIKTAAGASIRNYLTGLQLSSDTLGAATEVVIRDGAAGAVLWRGKLQTAAVAPQSLLFDPPLRGTANTLLEVATLTSTVTGGVYVNAQGFTAA